MRVCFASHLLSHAWPSSFRFLSGACVSLFSRASISCPPVNPDPGSHTNIHQTEPELYTYTPRRQHADACLHRTRRAKPIPFMERERNRSIDKGELDRTAISAGVSFPLMRKRMLGRLCPLTRFPSRRTSFSPRRLFILHAPPVMGRTLTNGQSSAASAPSF